MKLGRDATKQIERKKEKEKKYSLVCMIYSGVDLFPPLLWLIILCLECVWSLAGDSTAFRRVVHLFRLCYVGR